MVDVGLRVGEARIDGTRSAPPTPRVASGTRLRTTAATGSALLRALLVVVDAGALAVATIVAVRLGGSAATPGQTLGLTLGICTAGIAMFHALGLYRSRVCTLRPVEYALLARGCGLLALLVVVVATLSDRSVTAGQLAIGVPVAFVGTVVARDVYRSWLAGRRRGGAFLRSVVVVGSGDEARDMVDLLEAHPDLGYRIVGVVGGDPADAAAPHERSDALLATIRAADATGVIICANDLHHEELNRTVQQLLDAGVRVNLSSGLHGVDVRRLRPSPLAHEPMFSVEPMRLAPWQLGVKRAIDVVVAAVALLVAAPVLALAAAGIKMQDRGRVLFRQVRVGRDGDEFVLYKLRTMREGAELDPVTRSVGNVRDGPLVKVPDDPRVTRLGRLLRAASIDELPQLWNVLNGTMSLVGPRPALPDEVVHFDAELRARELVRPGVTGLWQVEGRDNPSFAAYRRLDLFYLRNWTIGLDLMILVATIGAVAARVLRGVANLERGAPVAPVVEDPARSHRSDLDGSIATGRSRQPLGSRLDARAS